MSEVSPRKDQRRVDAPRYQPLVIVLVAACAGIAVDRFWPLSVPVWWAVAGFGWVAWLALWRRGWERSGAAVLLLAVAATAASWHHCRWYLFDQHDLGNYARDVAQPVYLEAIARESARLVPEPAPDPMRVIPLGDRARLELEPVAIRDAGGWRRVSGRTRLEVYGRLPDVAAGDRLRIFGQLSAPRGTLNPGQFDYAEYLRAQRVRSLLRAQTAECVSVVAAGGGWNPLHWIDRARAHGNRLLEKHLDRRRSGLAAAVLLGARERVDFQQKEVFMQTGTVHLLAISGLHLGILAGGLLFVMLRAPIPRGRAMLVVAAFAVFYMLLTDARPPVVRATILVVVICVSLYLHRRAVSFNSLAAAALVVLAVNPCELFHTGAQLSFLAVAALMWFAPRWASPMGGQDPLERLIAESRGWPVRMLWALGRSVRHLTLVSATIWLLTTPLVTARFHLWTPIAVLLNTLLWIPMAAALICGFATVALGSVAAPLGQLFGWLCDANLWLLESSVNLARDLPFSHAWVSGPADWWLAVFYGGLALMAAFPRIRPPRRWFVAWLAGWLLVGFAAARPPRHPDRLDCTFLSVGHGCAVVVELPSGETLLYDAGQFGSGGSAAQTISGFLWSRGITHLDAVVLSHADMDHYNALPGLLQRVSVGRIYVAPGMWEDQSPALVALRRAIRESGVPLDELCAGDRLRCAADCVIETLHPPRAEISDRDNANSVVLLVEYLGHRILLPGDLEPPGLDALISGEPIDCDVLLVPHHGSRQSNPPGLAAWSKPRWVVISGSRRWDPREIETAYESAGSRVLHAADTGAIRVRIASEGVAVDSFLPP